MGTNFWDKNCQLTILLLLDSSLLSSVKIAKAMQKKKNYSSHYPTGLYVPYPPELISKTLSNGKDIKSDPLRSWNEVQLFPINTQVTYTGYILVSATENSK